MTEDVEAQKPPIDEETKALTDEKPVEIKQAEEKKVEPSITKGLTKEELMKFANDPFWIRLRLALFALFWLIWAAMLVASVVIIVYAPKCPSPEPKTWWQKGPMYKIDAADLDSNGDGMPFLKSLASELDYIVDAGFNSLYLGNIFGTAEDGTTNYENVSADLGTIDDWNSLVEQLNQRNIKVIIDLPTSATANAELVKIAETWIGRGVSGFNLGDSQFVNKIISEDQDAKDVVTSLRKVVDASEDEPKILTSFTDLNFDQLAPLYGSDIAENHIGSMFHLVTGKSLAASLPAPDSGSVFEFVQQIQNALPNNSWPGISLSSLATGSRLGESQPALVDTMNMLSFMLKATPIIKAGEELGIQSGSLGDWSARQDQVTAGQEGLVTHLSVFSELAKLRHGQTLLFGDVMNDEISGCSVITRIKRGNVGYVLIINFNAEEVELDVSKIRGMAESVSLKLSSLTGNKFVAPDDTEVKSFASKAVKIGPSETKLFEFVPDNKAFKEEKKEE